MEIIKEGVLRDSVKLRYTCSECGCIFELERGEISKHIDEPYYEIACPCCGHCVINSGNYLENFWIISKRNLISTCENCLYYQKMQRERTPQVGDSPCQWCEHNPIKIS